VRSTNTRRRGPMPYALREADRQTRSRPSSSSGGGGRVSPPFPPLSLKASGSPQPHLPFHLPLSAAITQPFVVRLPWFAHGNGAALEARDSVALDSLPSVFHGSVVSHETSFGLSRSTASSAGAMTVAMCSSALSSSTPVTSHKA
jgi:hypothetical protein